MKKKAKKSNLIPKKKSKRIQVIRKKPVIEKPTDQQKIAPVDEPYDGYGDIGWNRPWPLGY